MGNLVIPKAMHRSYMQENFTIFDFWLTDEELASITSLDRFDGRMSKDPDEFNSDL
jgi:2,5-diketo-D-gluconate reductase A